jgi:predicted RNA-binding protein
MTRQRTQELQKEKYEPGTEAYDISIEELPMERQIKKNKGKQPASFPYRPKTRPTNKLRLKSKYLFKPSLKEDKYDYLGG